MKHNRQLEQARKEANQEKAIRGKLEDSHKSMLSRVQSLEEAIESERKKVTYLNLY